MKKLAFAMATFIAFSGFSPALADTAFEQGVSNYNAGRYKHAVVFLTQAASLDPTNSLCHYYLANTLTRLNQAQEALMEYQICKRLDPIGPVATYCQQALVVLSGGSRQARHLADASEEMTISGITGSGQSSTARLSSHPDINRTMYVIRREVEFEKGKHTRLAEAGKKAALSMAEERASQIKQQADADIQRTIADSWTALPTLQGYPNVSQYVYNPQLARIRSDEIRQNAAEAEKRERHLGENKAAEFSKLATDKQKVLDEVAVNLKSQMEQPAGPSGVKLQALGTDLYVRYYGNYGKGTASGARTQGNGNNLALHAQRASGRFINDEQNSSSANSRIIKTVRGKVLH